MLLLLVVAYLVLTQNQTFWAHVHATLLEMPRGRASAVAGSVLLTQFVLTLFTLGALGLHRALKPVLILGIMTAASVSYFMDRYDVVIDPAMIRNLLETDRREASELLGPELLTHLLLWGVVPSVAVSLVPVRHARLRQALAARLLLLAMALLVLLVALGGQYRTLSFWGREHRDVRLYVNPTYPLYGAWRVAREQWWSPGPKRVAPLGRDAALAPALARRPLTMVLVVGETARADHFSLNGYPRRTNPRLAQRGELLSFPDVTSCGTYTGFSVPCMFSYLDQEQMTVAAARAQENLLDVLQQAGVRVRWLENDGGCKGVCARVETRVLGTDDDGLLCPATGCLDGVMIDWLVRDLQQRPEPLRSELIVVHPIGSHGPAYYRRVPPEFRVFKPSCEREELTSCSQQEIVNAYDNTLVYTDWLVDTLIATLERQRPDEDVALLYVSDHGESLGEYGVYLHGLPTVIAPRAQRHVPMLFWMSPSLQQRVDLRCVAATRATPLSHDHLFDLLLGLFRVETDIYRPAQDPWSGCAAG